MCRPSLFDLENHADFIRRHIGPSARQQNEMAQAMGYDDLDALIDDTVPNAIRREQPMQLGGPQTEQAVIARLRELAQLNVVNTLTQLKLLDSISDAWVTDTLKDKTTGNYVKRLAQRIKSMRTENKKK